MRGLEGCPQLSAGETWLKRLQHGHNLSAAPSYRHRIALKNRGCANPLGARWMPRKKIVLYNPRAVFFTMPLGLLAVGSALDRTRYDVVIVDARLEAV